MAQDIYAPLHGKTVAIDKLVGAFRECKCGHQKALISVEPIGMHQGHLKCERCGNVTSYLGRDHMAAMLAAHNAGEDAA